MSIKENNPSDFRYKQLQEFEVDVNWDKLIELIAHDYVESSIGRLLVPVESMIRVYFIQQRYKLNASEAALALSRIEVLRNFALIDMKTDVLPEESAIEAFNFLISQKSFFGIFEDTFDINPMQ